MQLPKELLLQHIRDSGRGGASLFELQQVLPGLSRGQIQTLLRELRREAKIRVEGVTKGARWYAGPEKRNSTQF